MSGRKENFDVSPDINPGVTYKVTIKKNNDGKFAFGPFTTQGTDHIKVNLFDAQEAINVEKISIRKSNSESFEASMLLRGETEPQPMESLGTEHFREADRISRKDLLNAIAPNAITAGSSMISSIISASTGTPV